MTASQTFTVVLDDEDTPEQLAALRALHAPSHGVVVCEPAPLKSSLHWLVSDILAALGKREDFNGAGRAADRGWARAIMWLIAEDVTDLVVARAGALAAAQWVDLGQIAAICQMNLWLVVLGRPMTKAQSRVAREWPFARVRYEGLPSIVGRKTPRGQAQAVTTAVPLPEVPTVDFTAFRAVCRSTLSGADFSRVERVYEKALTRVARKVGRRRPIDVNLAAELCCSEVEDSEDLNDALARLRAAQSVLFDRDTLVRVRVAQLAANTPRRPLDEKGATLLRGYAAPEYACLGALALAYDINPQTLATFSMSAISPEGRLENFEPSTPVAPLLIAQRLQRAWDGADEIDPLFSSGYANLSIGGTRPSPTLESSLHQRFRAIGRDTGIFTPAAWSRRVEISPVRQAAAYGVTIHPLTSDTDR